MTSKALKLLVGLLVGAILAGGLFSGGLAVGLFLPQLHSAQVTALAPSPSEGTPSGTPTSPQDVEVLFQPFWQAWDIVHSDFVDQPVDDVKLMEGAIRGMIDALGDEHSSYMDPDEYRQANVPLEGSYEGIGVWVDTDAEYLTVISPIPGTPAESAGLRPGDQVIAVDGEDMTGINPSLVIRKVLGPAGTSVQLTIRREGELEPLQFEIERARITVPSTESRMLEGGVAYIRLLTFGTQTTQDLRNELENLMGQHPKGMILDLRRNGGGLLTTALDVASEFISHGVIMIERYGDGREETYTAEPGGVATEIPLVVLIDGGSASASEIVAGAIQDRNRGLLVGEASFGKGSVQNWTPLARDGGAVRVTVARWLTPNGRQIDQVGLTPDVVVAMTDEDIAAHRDPQLDRAVELLQENGSSRSP